MLTTAAASMLGHYLRSSGMLTTVAASMLGHSREVNGKYFTSDVSGRPEWAKAVSEVNREACLTQHRVTRTHLLPSAGQNEQTVL